MSEIEAKVRPLEDPIADFEKLTIDSLEAKAKAKAEGDHPQPSSGDQVKSIALFVNGTSKFLYTIESHFWVGRTITNIPDLAIQEVGEPRQTGTLPEGVKWGVVYADGTDNTARKWVAAYDTATQQAYGEAGPTGPVDWNVVEAKLGMSSFRTEYADPILGGKIIASIFPTIDGHVAFGIFKD